MKETFLYLQVGAEKDILDMYINSKDTVKNIAAKYHVTTRTIQRLAKKHGVVRTVSEANKVAVKFKDYSWLKVPDHLKKTRTSLTVKMRYKILIKYKQCAVCRSKDELQIDHIDENPSNNSLKNLQVLCRLCNAGKYRLSKSK